MRRVVRLGVLVVAAVLSLGCERRESASAPGEVTATAAYERYFGAPPEVREGHAFAVAGFLPLVDNPGQVRPLPLFMIGDELKQDLLVSHLLGLPAHGIPEGLVNPFPPGTTLDSLQMRDGTAEVALAFAGGMPEDLVRVQGIASALGHTLAQFPEIERVRILAGGELLPRLAPEGFLPDPKDVLEPSAPVPVMVAGTWDGDRVEEVSVFFDRPLREVEEIRVAAGDATLEGEYYRSVFDMAVVIHPADPATIAEGMPVRVEWRVADPLGRRGEGRETFNLRRLEHP